MYTLILSLLYLISIVTLCVLTFIKDRKLNNEIISLKSKVTDLEKLADLQSDAVKCIGYNVDMLKVSAAISNLNNIRSVYQDLVDSGSENYELMGELKNQIDKSIEFINKISKEYKIDIKTVGKNGIIP